MGHISEAHRIARGQQGLVVGEFGRHRGAGEGKDDDLLEGVQVRELPVQRQQHVVDDQETVFRVGGDPADLVRRQAQVQRVHHPAGGRDAEITLQVRMVVPAQVATRSPFCSPRPCSAEASARVRR
jgi:hypothetical protein